MAAEFYIRIIPDKNTEKHVEGYLSYEYSTKDGYFYDLFKLKSDGRWYRRDELPKNVWENVNKYIAEINPVKLDFDLHRVLRTPGIWVGEVSWLKASMDRDTDTYVPSTILAISKLIRGITTLSEELIEKVYNAFKFPNRSIYRLNDAEVIKGFLTKNIGKKVFCSSE